MKISYKTLCILYPLLNIIVAFLLHGEGLMKLLVGYTSIFLFSFIVCKKGRKILINKKSLIVLILIFLEWFLFVTTVPSMYNIEQLFMFSLFIAVCFMFSNEDVQTDFCQWINKKDKFVLFVQVLYLVVLGFSCIFSDGVNRGQWGISSLKGPYEINHLLAYELLTFVLIDVIIMRKNKWAIVFLCINSSLIFLTAVRSVLLVWVIAALFYFYKKNIKQKFLMIIVGILALGFLISKTSLLDAVIKKTNTAINTSTITSGRGAIYLNSIEAYINAEKPIYWLSGMGQENLGLYNRNHKIWMNIHAHNDFIDALAQFGVIGFILCIISYISMIKAKKKIGLILVFVLAFSNGFYMYPTCLFGIMIFFQFGECMSRRNKKNEENINNKSIYCTDTRDCISALDQNC